MINITTDKKDIEMLTLLEEMKVIDTNNIEEQIKPIILDGVDTGYNVSNTGKVFSKTGKELIQPVLSGYHYAVIYNPTTNKKERYRVHRLVAFNFCHTRPLLSDNSDNLVVHHIDKNRSNNNYYNLIIVNNREHITIHSLLGDYSGENNNTSIYTEKQVIHVCKLLEKDKYTPGEISLLTGVSKDMISLIRSKKCWKHISENYNINPLFTHIDKETVIEICELLEKGFSNKEISQITNVKSKTISDIRTGHRHSDISCNYNIGLSRNRKMSISIVHEICKMLESGKYTYKEISVKTGISTDRICRIKIGRSFKNISSLYNLK